MKLGEAIKEVQLLQSKLIRLHSSRKQLFSYLKTNTPEFDFKTLDNEIEKTHKEIIRLKLAIQRTNIRSKITIKIDDNNTKEMIIQEAILIIGQIRSELSQYQTELIPKQANVEYGRERIVEYFQPISEKERQERLEILEKKKRQFDLALQGANWTIELIE